jgi:hypothetical protein
MRPTTEDMPEQIALFCVECGREIDLCAFCDSTSCGTALCYRCVNRMLGPAGHPEAAYAWRLNAPARPFPG